MPAFVCRRIFRRSKPLFKILLAISLFTSFLYLINIVHPSSIRGPSGENISEKSSFFLLENELNMISLSNKTPSGSEMDMWSLIGNNSFFDPDGKDDNQQPEVEDYEDEDEQEVWTKKLGPFKNGTAGAKYIFGHEYGNKQLCTRRGNGTKAIIIIHTAPDNRKKRMAIRRTWGRQAEEEGLLVAFLVGQLEGKRIKGLVRDEIDRFQDMIIGNYKERYYELPIKTMSMLEWVGFYCHKAMFVVKADDDVYINIANLLSYLKINEGRGEGIFGRVLRVGPVRNPKSKYYISPQEYPKRFLPAYVQGFCYIFTASLSKELFHAALNTTYVRFEDLFITGIVANSLKIERVKSHMFPNYKHGPPDNCIANKIIAMHRVKPDLQYELQAVTQGVKKCLVKK